MGKRIYVGNLSYNTSDEQLRAAFAADGRAVDDVHVVMDRDTGRSRGFGFVEMASPKDAEAAIAALDGAMLDGRALRVSEARDRPGGGNGARGGRGGGNGGDRGDRGGFGGDRDRGARGGFSGDRGSRGGGGGFGGGRRRYGDD